MAVMKPIRVWVHGPSPNPIKVLIALEELGIPYEKISVENPKDEAFLKINPNGRVPAIQDPNADNLVLWESGAIVEYLVETYDKDNTLTFVHGPEKWLLKQYLHFQMSGQGPYFGQHVWFHKFHEEDVPSAKKRYDEQMLRVFGVLDRILEGKKYLVGNKFTYADLAFIPWNNIVRGFQVDLWKNGKVDQKYPNFTAWHNRLMDRPAVKKVYDQ